MLVGIPLWEPLALTPIERERPALSAAASWEASETFSAFGVARPGYLCAWGWSPPHGFSGECAIDAGVVFAEDMVWFLGYLAFTGCHC